MHVQLVMYSALFVHSSGYDVYVIIHYSVLVVMSY